MDEMRARLTEPAILARSNAAPAEFTLSRILRLRIGLAPSFNSPQTLEG
jgi:hypothetical protein